MSPLPFFLVAMADSFRSWILDHRPDERHAGQSRPDLLLLDEPSQGPGPRIVDQIFDNDRPQPARAPADHPAGRAAGRGVTRAVQPRLRAQDRRVVLAGARDALAATRAFSAPTWAPARDARLVALTRLDRQTTGRRPTPRPRRHNRPVHDSTHLKRPAR